MALRVLSGRLGRDLAAEGVAILPMGGVTNIRAFAHTHGPQGRGRRVIGLYDIGEEHHVRRGLAAAGLPVDAVVGPVAQGFHACDPDLEGELLRALGLDAAEAVVDAAGEGRSLRLLAQMSAQQGWSREQLLRRFLGRSPDARRGAPSSSRRPSTSTGHRAPCSTCSGRAPRSLQACDSCSSVTVRPPTTSSERSTPPSPEPD